MDFTASDLRWIHEALDQLRQRRIKTASYVLSRWRKGDHDPKTGLVRDEFAKHLRAEAEEIRALMDKLPH